MHKLCMFYISILYSYTVSVYSTRSNTYTIVIVTILRLLMPRATVNRERFAGLNFCAFHCFQEHCKSFSVNIHFFIQAAYNGIVLVL